MAKLKEYHYPGNIRELSKIIKNAAFFAETDIVLFEDIDYCSDLVKDEIWEKTKNMSLYESKRFFEKELISRRMRRMGDDVNKVAESLGMIKNNLYRKLNDLSIDY